MLMLGIPIEVLNTLQTGLLSGSQLTIISSCQNVVCGHSFTPSGNSRSFRKLLLNQTTIIAIRSVVKDRAGSLGRSNITPHYPDRTDC